MTALNNIFSSLGNFEEIIPSLDRIYSQLTLHFRIITPILKKRSFNQEEKILLKPELQKIHQALERFFQLVRRAAAERIFFATELNRLKSANPSGQAEYLEAEEELKSFAKELALREKGLIYLSDLVQLLDSVVRLGEMNEIDEKLLTDIVLNLKNLAA